MADFDMFLSQFLLSMSQYPSLLMVGVTLIFVASSFGFPLPEEVVLITSGLIANVAMKAAEASGQAPTINLWILASVCFISVLGSDMLVFALGRKYGISLLKRRPFNRVMTENTLGHVERWTRKYGPLACAVFRFTPALRFPGHFMCGAMKIKYRTFLATDGVAALLSVPTQVILVGLYGDQILGSIKQFKIVLLCALAVVGICWMIFKLKAKFTKKTAVPIALLEAPLSMRKTKPGAVDKAA